MSDRSNPEPSFWLTGSNQIQIDRKLKESLAGRASYFKFHTLSVSELERAGLAIQPENLFLRGGWPQLHADSDLNPIPFLSDYITTVIEKDVVLTAGIQKVLEFIKAVRLLAGRSAQSLVVSNIAQDAGVKQPTVNEWISVLERMQIVSLVEPYYDDANRRLLRSPKLFFQDVGLAVRLQGWTEMAPLLVSPLVGPLFETLVYSELIKTAAAGGFDWQVYYIRNKEKEEVDFFIHGSNQSKLALEVKWASGEAAQWRVPRGLRSVVGDAKVAVVSFQGGPSRTQGVTHLSLTELGSFLRANL